MAKEVKRDSVSDTANYGATARVTSEDGSKLYHFENQQDQDITVGVYGTYDGDSAGTGEVSISQSNTVSSGGGTNTVTVSDPWDEVHFDYTAATGPSGNNDFVIRELLEYHD